MALSNLQTECPHCQTRFRVTGEQLKIAKGRVRCGSCLKIFNALENRIEEPKSVATAPSVPKVEQEIEPEPDSDEDLIFADNPEEDAAQGAYLKPDMTFSEDELSDSFRSMDHSVYSDDRNNKSDLSRDSDESWADSMLDESSHTDQLQPAIPPASARNPQLKPSAGPETPDRSAQKLRLPGDTSPLLPEQRIYPVTGASSPQTPYSNLRQESISVPRNHHGKIRVFVWSLIILAILSVIVSQLAWVQFDRLSKIPQLRPFYQKGCELTGCTLPPLVDMSAIASRKLVVKTNPANRSELIVDAVIINRAAFAQPFPAIVLAFADLNGREVTRRVFNPADYLVDQAAQLREIPPQTPVRISITIQDPGQTAVSYNIDFRPRTD